MTDTAQGDEIEGRDLATLMELQAREDVEVMEALERIVVAREAKARREATAELASLRRAISDHHDLSRKVAASLQGQLAAESERCGRWEARALLAEGKLAEAVGALGWIAGMAEVRAADDKQVFTRVNRGALRNIAARARATLSHLETETRDDG